LPLFFTLFFPLLYKISVIDFVYKIAFSLLLIINFHSYQNLAWLISSYNRNAYNSNMNRKDCSGLRRFDGEDLDHGDRVFKQQYQQKLWIESQVQEKLNKKQQEADEARNWAQYHQQVHDWRKQEEENFRANQTAMEKACKEANIQLIKEKLAREKAERETETMQGLNDIEYVTSSKFMTEDPETMQSALAAHRVIPYHFKGFNDEQRANVIDGQKQQILEKEEKRRMQKEQEKREAKMGEAQRRALVLYEREMKLKNDRANEEHREYLKTQMAEQQVKNKDPYNLAGSDYLIPFK
jgi:hypothetical protein